MQLPIGYDIFSELIERQLDFVDKTMLIKELLDDKFTKIAVITRPRRFGKTLNLTMLRCFLAAQVRGKSTRGMFDRLKIAKAGSQYMQHQGQYPVIFLTLKSIKEKSYDYAYRTLLHLLSDLYQEHDIVLTNPHLKATQKSFFEAVLNKTVNPAEVKFALKNLSECVELHYGVKPWILIDEYDTPMQAAYLNGYWEEMADLMRGLFVEGFKTNDSLNRAVITGILRIAKESLFSGVNNLKVYSVLNKEYSEHFGFTEPEVGSILKQSHLQDQLPEVQKWYNGYQVGKTIIYNPWSIVNFVHDQEFKPYWVNTSDNQLIRTLLTRSSDEFKEQFESLLQEKPIEKLISEHTVFSDLTTNTEAAWSLLLMSGYLKVTSHRASRDGTLYTLAIPNWEVRSLYQQIIKTWLSGTHGVQWYNQFLEYLLSGNVERFSLDLERLMEQTASVHDFAQNPEAFYHGFMMGLTASLHYDERYELYSNRESGYGRYDYMILSKVPDRYTVILEFKRVKPMDDLAKLEMTLDKTAQDALQQIENQQYLAQAKQCHCSKILKLGLAFSGKHFKLHYEYVV